MRPVFAVIVPAVNMCVNGDSVMVSGRLECCVIVIIIIMGMAAGCDLGENQRKNEQDGCRVFDMIIP